MITLEDSASWPAVGSIWRHKNGADYQVVDFTNIASHDQDKYPVTIVYRGLMNRKLWSRPLRDWERSMTLVTL